jgi:membrane protein DedA with SNARE-associated domain
MRARVRLSRRAIAIIVLLVVVVGAGWLLYRQYAPNITLNRVLDWYAEYGYWAVFVPVLLETAGVPVPGETSLLFAGVASATGRIDLYWAIAVGAAAAIIGDNIGYCIGRFGGRRLVDRLAGYGGLTRSLAWGEDYFARRGGITVFLARWLPGLRIFGAWIAGMVHMRWWKFALWNAAGGISWAITIVLLGHFFGKSLHVVERVLGLGGVIVLIVIAAGALYLWRRHEKAKQAEQEAEALAARASARREDPGPSAG